MARADSGLLSGLGFARIKDSISTVLPMPYRGRRHKMRKRNAECVVARGGGGTQTRWW